MDATCHGQSVLVYNLADFEKLAQHPGAIRGEWDGKMGRVTFAGLTAARMARYEL